MKSISELQEKYPNIPANTIESLKLYAEKGLPTGGFLRAVLSNDLFEAIARADNDNQKAIVDIVKLIYNDCPMGCHGSQTMIDEWCVSQRRKSK